MLRTIASTKVGSLVLSSLRSMALQALKVVRMLGSKRTGAPRLLAAATGATHGRAELHWREIISLAGGSGKPIMPLPQPVSRRTCAAFLYFQGKQEPAWKH